MILLPVHVIGGLLGIVAGFVALAALKGGRRHRRSGMVFVYAMLIMSATGAAIALLKSSGWGTAMGGFLAFYLVTTGLLTSRRRVPGFQWTDIAALLMAVALGVTYYRFGFQAVSSPSGKAYGYPSPLYFVFGSVTWLAVIGDLRMLVRGIQGARRLARHVWRMCFAMFIATASFFLGQAKVIPEPIRIMPLLWIPVLAVVGVMFYWLARLRFTKRFALTKIVHQHEVSARLVHLRVEERVTIG